MLGNVVLWKPALTTTKASWSVYQILEEAGVPKGMGQNVKYFTAYRDYKASHAVLRLKCFCSCLGIINFLPSSGSMFGGTVTSSPDLAGLTFVGSGP